MLSADSNKDKKNFLIILILASVVIVLMCVFFGNNKDSNKQVQDSDCNEETGVCQMPEKPWE